MDFQESHHQWIVLLVRIYTGTECAEPHLQPPHSPLTPPFPSSTFSPGLLAALLDLPAADSSQGNEQHQQTHGQANSYPQSHRGERDVLTWSKGQREEGGTGGESLIIHSCRAKIRAQLSRLYPSPLFHHLTIFAVRVRYHKNPKLSGLQNMKRNTMTLMMIIAIIISVIVVKLVISSPHKVWLWGRAGLSEKTEMSVNLCLMWME